MNKESWLKPVSKDDVTSFAHNQMNLDKIMVLEEVQDENYGKFFRVGGFAAEPVVSGWGRANKYMNPVALGEYGPLDVDPYGETTIDDMKQLFSGDENLINIYLAWVAFVADKNQGRKIDGKTYTESFSNACTAQIDLEKTAQIRKVEREANEKKECVKTFVGQLEKAESANENQQSK